MNDTAGHTQLLSRLIRISWRVNWRLVFANALTLILFSIGHGFVIEILIARFTFAQFFWTRLSGIGIDVFIGHPTGLYTDWMRRKFRFFGWKYFRRSSLRLKTRKVILRYVSDTIAFASSQLPIYVLVLAIIGVGWRQIAVASSVLVLTVTPAGGPYGLFLNFVRRLCGITETKTIKANS